MTKERDRQLVICAGLRELGYASLGDCWFTAGPKKRRLPGKNRYVGILPGHAPLITKLGIGEISYRENEQSHSLSVAWGFAEVLPDRSILAETAEHAEEIDVRRQNKP